MACSFLLRRAPFRGRKTPLPWLLLASGLVFVPWSAQADREQEARYPYDPACAWGRIANGRGMLHRCITEAEAQALLGQPPSELSSPGAPPSQQATPSEGAEAREPEPPTPPQSDFTLTVGPIEAEEGELTLGALNKPLERYRECIATNGGLSGARGSVVVRFLVRADRRRAEGTEVESFQGVSQRAAQCIASVVDRRQVGTPSVPLTGTRLTFQLQEKR